MSDLITEELDEDIDNMALDNPITDQFLTMYATLRDLIFTSVTTVLIPFLMFLTFGSSFINRNQTVTSYLMTSMAIVLLTPAIIFLFSEIITNLTNVSILDSTYLATTFFDNFLYIMVANMILTLASFVFVNKSGVHMS